MELAIEAALAPFLWGEGTGEGRLDLGLVSAAPCPYQAGWIAPLKLALIKSATS